MRVDEEVGPLTWGGAQFFIYIYILQGTILGHSTACGLTLVAISLKELSISPKNI